MSGGVRFHDFACTFPRASMTWSGEPRQICFAPSQDITSMTPLHAFEKKSRSCVVTFQLFILHIARPRGRHSDWLTLLTCCFAGGQGFRVCTVL